MHIHGADRHAGERVIAEPARDARVQHSGQPEVGAHAEAELQGRGAAAASDELSGGLDIGHDADGRSPRIHAAAERQSHRNEQRRAPLTRPAPAPNPMAPSSGKSMAWGITRWRASTTAS